MCQITASESGSNLSHNLKRREEMKADMSEGKRSYSRWTRAARPKVGGRERPWE